MLEMSEQKATKINAFRNEPKIMRWWNYEAAETI